MIHNLILLLAFLGAASLLLPALWLAMASRTPTDPVSPPCCGGPATRDPAHRHAAGCPYAQAA